MSTFYPLQIWLGFGQTNVQKQDVVTVSIEREDKEWFQSLY